MDNNKSLAKAQEKEFIDSSVRAEALEKECNVKTEAYAPLPLQREIKQAQPYPFEALGKVVGAAARRIHEVVQAPDATCGQSVLAALSLACQGFIDVQIDGRSYPTSIFMITISESGERKSATDKIALKAIYEWQRMLIKQHKQKAVEYKNKHELWKRKRDGMLKDSASEGKLLHFEPEPKVPCEGLMLCDEPTLEGLEQLLEKGQPSAGIFSDEGGRLVGGHAMNKDNALKTACGLSSLWDGKPLTRVRKNDGSKIYYGRRVAMHLMMQPIVLTELMSNTTLMGQGVLARCLFSAPGAMSGNRKYKEVDLNSDPAILTFHELINAILDQPYPKEPGDEGENDDDFHPGDALNPQPVTLNGLSKEIWVKFHNQTDEKMSEDGVYSSIKSFASKAPEQVLRIAAIFAYAEQLKCIGKKQTQIQVEHLERAITLVEYYLDEALRILGHSVCDPNLSLASQALDWLKRHRSAQIFPISDVYQYGPPQIRNAAKAKQVMGILKRHDYVIDIANAVINGRNVRLAWRLI